MTSAEIVQTAEEARSLSMPPLLILDEVEKYLDQQGLGAGDLTVDRIGDGRSNITYRICRSGVDLVLRRGPRPPLPKSTHDMVREARVQQALRGQGFPVPEIRAVCEDEDLLGVPFYLMDYIGGEVVTDSVPNQFDDADTRRGLTAELVQVLQKLHMVDVSQPEISALGKPEGYLQRQVERFAKLWPINTQRDIPLVAELAETLHKNLPATQQHAVIHGDYRLGNVMYDDAVPAGGQPRIAAVLDWEMATLGDPLSDLGYLTATYSQGGEGNVLAASPVTAEPGFHTRDELVEEYAADSSLDLEMLPWYQTLALWKSAIFCEAMYTRWLRGERPGDSFAESLEQGVPRLLDGALGYARKIPGA